MQAPEASQRNAPRRLKYASGLFNPIQKGMIMGLDIYFSKKTFIGAMFRSSGIGGTINLTKRGVPIPIKAERLAYVEEDIFHGRKTYWLLEWLNHELSEVLTNAGEQEISGDVMDRLHQACIEVLAHKDMPDFREVCREKLRCLLKPDISEEAKNSFIEEVEELAKATSPEEKTADAVFHVSASW